MSRGHCGYDTCSGSILRGEAVTEDGEVLSTNLATLKVDGEVVPMGRFPQKILRGVTLRVLNSLKSVGQHPKNIEISIKMD